MDKIIVTVRGGVAYCDDPRVTIVDYDDLEASDATLTIFCNHGEHDRCPDVDAICCECSCHLRSSR